MKACEALIAWNSLTEPGRPPGAVAVGPLMDEDEDDWTGPYGNTCGAAYVARRSLPPEQQAFAVLKDFYLLAFSYGLDPYIVHRAFLHIDEYQETIKRMGWGPAPGELGHDPDVSYGRVVRSPPVQELCAGGAVHVWPMLSEQP